MAIRIRNIDTNTEGQYRHAIARFGLTSATEDRSLAILTIPVAAQIRDFGIVNSVAISGNTSSTLRVRFHLASASDSVIATRLINTSAASDNISANQRWVVTANATSNTVTAGQVITIQTSAASGNAGFAEAFVDVRYSPLKHRETR